MCGRQNYQQALDLTLIALLIEAADVTEEPFFINCADAVIMFD